MAALSPLSLLPGPVNNERTWGAPQDLRVGLALDGLSPPSQHSPSPSPISVQEGWRPGRGKWRWRGADTPRGALYPLAAASGAAAPDLRILHPRPPAGPRDYRAGNVAGGTGRGPRRSTESGRRYPPHRLGLLPSPPPPGRNCRAPDRGGCAEPSGATSLRPAFPTPSRPAVRAASCAAPAGFGAAARGPDASLQFGAHARQGGSE